MKKDEIILRDCKKCTRSFEVENVLYCSLMLQDKNILKSSGKVTKKDCIWYKSK